MRRLLLTSRRVAAAGTCAAATDVAPAEMHAGALIDVPADRSSDQPHRAPARVVFTSGFAHRFTGGVKEFAIEAATLRGVIKAMETRFPGLGDILEEQTSVVLDGEMHEVVYSQPLAPGCEVFFLPRIEGG